MDWWEPDVGCFIEGAFVGEVWVRVRGLPMHLWGKEFFKRVGDACGGFVVVDMETEERRYLTLTRLLVKFSGRKVLNWLMAVDNEVVFALCL